MSIKQFLAAFKELGYDAKVNQPYDGKLGGNHVQNNSIGFEVDPSRQGILFEFRNDLLVHPEKGPKLRADFIAILDKVLQLKKPPTAINIFPMLPAPQSIVDSFLAENSVVVSYNKEKQVRLAFIAEHAGEDLPYGYSWSVNDQKNIVSKNLHFDKNSRELAIFLAHYFETSLIFTRLSKLVVDANSQLTNNDIFPQKVMGMAVDLNTNLSTEEETRRYERYFMGLVKGILYLHERVSSHFWFSIQGFPADLLPESDLVISFYTNDNFAKKSAEKFIKAGYKVTLNPPMFNGKLLFGYTNLTFLNGFYPRKRESLVFLVSSRQMESNFAKLKADFSDILKSLCLPSTKS